MGNKRRNKNKSRAQKNKEEAGANGISCIENLPTEMLENLLKYVDTRSLSKCRRVNRRWCSVSSGILCQRPDMEIEFLFSNYLGFIARSKQFEKRTLKDFIDCFKDSTSCPITRLSIFEDNHRLEYSLFEHEDWLQFLSDYDISRVKSLKLRSRVRNSEDHFVNFMQKIRDLLLRDFPHLEEFELYLPFGDEPSGIELFPPTAKNNATPAPAPVPTPFQLPNLKVLRFQQTMLKSYPQISRHLLNAAVNLKKVHVYPRNCDIVLEAFAVLHSVGKLCLLQEAHIELSEEFLSTLKQSSTPPFVFKLKELELTHVKIYKQSVWEDAVGFLSNLFESSKDSLRKLSIQPLVLELPTLKNLEELKLKHSSSPDPFFKESVRNLDIFPAVRHLDSEFSFAWHDGFPRTDFIPRFPSLKSLTVNNAAIFGDTIAEMALLCPNLKGFRIKSDKNKRSPVSSFLKVGRAICFHMNQLESLELDFDTSWPENKPATLDSCFTGISVENCRRLSKIKKAAQALESCGIPVDIPESKLKAKREFPSILDMKDLLKLTLNSSSKNNSLGKREFPKRLSWITKSFALKLMPQLEINGVKF